jgi:malate/lactate dehydrogenase
MRETLLLLDRVRRALPSKSNYALAKALGTSQSDLNRVMTGEHGLGLKSLVRIAEITEIPLIDVLAITQEEIAKTPGNKAFWGQRSPRASKTVAVTALAFAAFGLVVQDARAGLLEISSVAISPVIHYAKLKKFLTFAKRLFASLIDSTPTRARLQIA